VPSKGYEFINDIRDGAVPNEYVNSIEQGVLGAMELGILEGFPVVDVKVTLYDGSYHEADSNEMAFKFAGATAFKEAAKKASPVLLESMMAVEIEVRWLRKFGQRDEWRVVPLTAINMAETRSNDDATSAPESYSSVQSEGGPSRTKRG
jgi:hypothetical protein